MSLPTDKSAPAEDRSNAADAVRFSVLGGEIISVGTTVLFAYQAVPRLTEATCRFPADDLSLGLPAHWYL